MEYTRRLAPRTLQGQELAVLGHALAFERLVFEGEVGGFEEVPRAFMGVARERRLTETMTAGNPPQGSRKAVVVVLLSSDSFLERIQ